jgi:tetratricopeptide (TPR) repeat protein
VRPPRAAEAAGNLGNVLVARGRAAEALPLFARDLAASTKAFGPEHPKVGLALSNLADAERALGRHDDARRHALQGLAVLERALGKDNPDLAYPELGLGLLDLATGRRAHAVGHLERALALRTAAGVAPDLIEEARAALARARARR